MSDDSALRAGDLREVRAQTVALINDWRRHIEIWTQLQAQALGTGKRERAARIAHLIAECEINLRQAEHRLETLQQLMDDGKRATSL